MPCKRQLHFCEIKFDQNGTVIPNKRPKLTSENGPCRSSVSTEPNLPPRYRYISIAPRSATSPVTSETTPKQLPFTTPHQKSANKPPEPEPVYSPTQHDEMPEFLSRDVDWVSCLKVLLPLKYPHFQVSSWKSTDGEHCIAAERDLSRYHPSLMPIPSVSPVSLHVSASGKYSVKVLFRDALNGTLKYEEDVASLLDIMTDYVVCPGLKIAPEIESTSIRTWGFPFGRIDSKRCSLLHRPQNKKQVPGSDLFNVCFNCKKLSQKLKEMAKIRNNNGENRVKSSSTRTGGF